VVVLVSIIRFSRHKSRYNDRVLGDVGVGGLTLGGGLSFLSAEYGLVCDNVVNYEVVLADASIVNANASSNSNLYWALKGGGNQFGEHVSHCESPIAYM